MGLGKKLLKAIKKPAKRVTSVPGDTRAGVRKVRREIRRADLAVFGGAGLRKNLRRIKKELLDPGSTGNKPSTPKGY